MRFLLSEPQLKFLRSDAKGLLFCGGGGSGKTWIGSHWVREKIASETKADGLIGANTYKQLHNVTLNSVFNHFDEMGILYQYRQHSGVLTAEGRRIYCVSLENYEMVRGLNLGWFWLDEVRDTKQAAFEVLLGRLRDQRANKLEFRMTSTPVGFNWLYDYFEGEKKIDGFELVRASAYSNRRNLPDDYLATLEQSYDKLMFQQEVMGEFVNTGTGRIYYSFDRTRNVKEVKRNPDYPLWIGMDFNVDPMTAVVCQNYGNKIYVLDEFFLRNSDTWKMGKAVLEKYGPGISIIPDSTGNAMKTAGVGKSDHQILRDYGFKVLGHQNPFRMDRYNCVNNLLEKERLIIDPNCKKTIKDLEAVSFRPGSSDPETNSDKTLTHISDALGYFCWYAYPIVKPGTGIYSVPR